MIAPWITEPDVDVESLIDAEDLRRLAVPVKEPVKPPWYPQSLGDAEWCMGRLALVESELGAIETQRAEWQQQLDDWHVTALRRPKARRALFVDWLTDYGHRRRREDPRCKTITLPSGAIKTQEHKERVVVEDEERLVKWLRESAPEALKVTETVKLRELRALASIDGGEVHVQGEMIPGVTIEPEHVTVTVST